MKLILVAIDEALANAWNREFHGVVDVEIHSGSIFEVTADALVSPANSYGFMDGGIDALYTKTFGRNVQLRLRQAILEHHHGELLVGTAEVVTTGNDKHPYLIAAPTMRVPMILDSNSINPFLATRAALLLVKHGAFRIEPLTGVQVLDRIQTIAFPGMGTGVGQVSPARCARQMRAAFDQVTQGRTRMPSSWAEASEAHQLLYTSRPKRLQ